MQKHTHKKRKKYFIDKAFQGKLAMKFCFLIIASSMLVAVLIYYLNQHTITVAFEGLKVVAKSTSNFVLPVTLGVLAIVTFLAGIAGVFAIVIISHRIVGPLYRLKIELGKIASGDLSSPIHVRTKDQLQKVAVEFDSMRVSFKGSIGVLKENWGPVKMSLDKLKKEMDQKEKNEIEDYIKKIDSELSRFKT